MWNYIVVCGEEEEKNGSVDVNPRDAEDQLKGKIRLDLFHQKLQGLFPEKSGAWHRFYNNVWNPADYGIADASL